jgi:hypothetical protein
MEAVIINEKSQGLSLPGWQDGFFLANTALPESSVLRFAVPEKRTAHV